MDAQDSRYKIKQMILYVASEMKDAPRFGSVKLNKVLYRADHEAYRLLGRKMTTFRYQKNTLGPTLSAFLHVTRELEAAGALEWEERPAGKRSEKRPCAKKQPDVGVFSPEERAILNGEIKRAWSSTGSGVSDEEHKTAAWFATSMGELIPAELTLVEDPAVIIPLSHAEEERVRTVVERLRARELNP